jgi:hypothetical protein
MADTLYARQTRLLMHEILFAICACWERGLTEGLFSNFWYTKYPLPYKTGSSCQKTSVILTSLRLVFSILLRTHAPTSQIIASYRCACRHVATNFKTIFKGKTRCFHTKNRVPKWVWPAVQVTRGVVHPSGNFLRRRQVALPSRTVLIFYDIYEYVQ